MPDENSDLETSVERHELSWLGEGIVLSQQVLVVALAMSLPILVGYGVDRWTGSKFPAGMLAGCLFGMLSGGWQLRQLMRWLERRSRVGHSPPSSPVQVGRSQRHATDQNASERNESDRTDD